MSSGRSPAEIMLKRKLNLLIDNIRPSVTSNLEAASIKQTIDHDKHSQYRELNINDMVWIKNEHKRGYHPGVIVERTGHLSYRVEKNGIYKRKHSDQLRARYGSDERTPINSDAIENL
ncbi:hypothetical protein HZS_6730, partial [Henneguya salminicola]